MRVLLATDGSASADRARDLVAGLRWPVGTTIRIVTAIDAHLEMLAAPFAMAGGEVVNELDAELARHADLALDAAERVITGAGLHAERTTRQERAADAILDEARDWNADLVVVGNRGHSTLATMLLGSTCAEVVDHAPCPVLVARESSIGEVVLASDGSPTAIAAERLLEDWPMFHGLRTTVVSVAPATAPWTLGLAAGIYDASIATPDRSDATARVEAADVADSVVTRLANAGVAAVARAVEGDAATEIVAVARGASRALIVMGSRGHTGIARLVLGGTARNVLQHASASILIVRQGVHVAIPEATPAPEEAREPVAVG